MQHIYSTKSLARLWRQLIFVPMWHNRWLTKSLKNELTHAIAQAELGHRGEICLVIENHLPIGTAYHTDCRERALELFGVYRVWDTADNTGVLIYVNVCEHTLEVIADRGIDACVEEGAWQDLIQTALTMCRQGDFQTALSGLIEGIGMLLRTHYPSDDVSGNELANDVIFLK